MPATEEAAHWKILSSFLFGLSGFLPLDEGLGADTEVRGGATFSDKQMDALALSALCARIERDHRWD